MISLRQVVIAGLSFSAMLLQAVEIRLPESPAPMEKAAGKLLKKHILQIDENSNAVFDLAIDDSLAVEAWSAAGDGGKVLLRGGKHGLFYAVAHYLRDICGVDWYSPYEKSPARNGIPVNFAPVSGDFAFSVRDIYSTYGQDGGEFAVLSGLNGNGDAGIAPHLGGGKLFGPPYFCHTLGMYIPHKEHFEAHPEWFAEIDGKRLSAPGTGINGSQLCLSNKALRQEVLRKLRLYIAAGKENAGKKGIPPPAVYDISQNDNTKYCRCAECTALAAKYGNTQSGVMLDFVNEIAIAIAGEEPDILISTFAYQYTEKPPANIRPHSNVLVILCDTASNVLRPLTHPENSYFNNLLKEWSALTSNIRIWDYNVTYQKPNEMPYNSEYTYRDDLLFFKEHGVTQVFTEFEYPVTADARDYKLFLKTALLENPDADTAALSKRFSDDFYGPAGPLFLEYRELLRQSQLAQKPYLGMYPSVNAFTHLNLATVSRAQELFDSGAQLLQDDPVRLKRWRHARLSLDRATLILSRGLMVEYLKKHPDLSAFPFDRSSIAERVHATAAEQAELRMPLKEREKFMKELDAEIKKYAAEISPKSLAVPELFSGIPSVYRFDYTMENSSRWKDVVELVDDPDSDIGKVACLAFPHKDPAVLLEKYQFPLLFGIYSPERKKNLWGHNFTAPRVKGPGYHWYKLGESKLSPDCFMFIFWSWYIQQGIADAFDPNHPDQKFEIWLRMKFTGPAYPSGSENETNAIWIERLMLIRKYELTAAKAEQDGITVNGRKKYLAVRDGRRWLFQYERDFSLPERAADWSDELRLSPHFWRKHPKYIQNGIAGYTGRITMELKSPEPIARLKVSGQIMNYLDSNQRSAELRYSLDGKNFSTLQKITYKAGSGTFDAELKPPPGCKSVTLQFNRADTAKDPGADSFGAIFKKIGVFMEGNVD